MSIWEECRAASDAGGIQFPYMMLACEFEIQKVREPAGRLLACPVG